MSSFSSLTFLNPAFLWCLLLLPPLWLLFKAIPPSPQKLSLATAHFLSDLQTQESDKAEIPWWLKLLRLALFTIIILAASGPVINSSKTPESYKGEAIAILLDNSWSSEVIKDKQKSKAQSLINLAERTGKTVILMESAPLFQHGAQILTPHEARQHIEDYLVRPWPSDISSLKTTLNEQEKILKQAGSFHYLGNGYNASGLKPLLKYLSNFGDVYYYKPEQNERALLLKPGRNDAGQRSLNHVQIDGYYNQNTPTLEVFLKDKAHNILGFKSLDTIKLNDNMDISDLWQNLSRQSSDTRQPAYIQIGNKRHAGSVLFLPQNIISQRIGILSSQDYIDPDSSPLLQSIYYIGKAVEDKAPYQIGALDTLMEWQPSIIIIPDSYALSSTEANKLKLWVEQGGYLLRFPPPQLDNMDELFPVDIMPEQRSVAGRLDWQEPLKLESAAEVSPLYGLNIDDTIEVKKQLLAVPSSELANHSWLNLSDGTPLVTARTQGAGRLILVHTQARPGWSNLSLSGYFVYMLHRIVDLSSGASINVNIDQGSIDDNKSQYELTSKILARGTMQPAHSELTVFSLDELKQKQLGADFWPGIYKSGNSEVIINIGDKITSLQPIHAAQLSAAIKGYDVSLEFKLTPYLLIFVIILFIIEWLATAVLSGLRPIARSFKGIKAGFIILLFSMTIFSTGYANAQSTDRDIQRASNLHLAYIASQNPVANAMAEKGLKYVAENLNTRTALKDVKVVALNPEQDQLAFYPLIYWPLPVSEITLSDDASAHINKYISHGGMLFIDTRTGRTSSNYIYQDRSNLSVLSENLYLPALSPLPADHVLRKSYYLLGNKNIAGRYTGGEIWLDIDEREDSQYVASVIIGANDWMGLWSDEQADRQQRERALRFGINLVMYALTGTYKQDQVHTKAILERLEKRQQRLRTVR